MVLVTPPVAWLAAHKLGLALSPRAADWGLGDSVALWLAWVLLVSPLLEEAVYRAAVQQPLGHWLLGRGVPHAGHLANVGAVLAMVAVHAPTRGLVVVWWLLPALVLGELYRQTRRVGPCVALHAWFNATLWWASS